MGFATSILSYELYPQLLPSQVAQARQGPLDNLANLARYLQFPYMNFDHFYARARDIVEGRSFQNFPASLQRLRPLSEDYLASLGIVRTALNQEPLYADALRDTIESLATTHTEFAQALNQEIYALFPGEPEIILNQQRHALNLFCFALSAQLERISPELFELWKADAETIGGDLLPVFPGLAILHLLETPEYPVTEPFKEQSDEIKALRALYAKLTPEKKEKLLKAICKVRVNLSADEQEIFNRIGNIHYQLKNEKKAILNGIVQILYQELRKSFSLLEKMKGMESSRVRGSERDFRMVFLSLMKQDSITDENGAISPDLVPCDLCSNDKLKYAVLEFFKKYHEFNQDEKVNFDRQFLQCIKASLKLHDVKTYNLLSDWGDLFAFWIEKMRLPTLYPKLPKIREIRDRDPSDMRYLYTN